MQRVHEINMQNHQFEYNGRKLLCIPKEFNVQLQFDFKGKKKFSGHCLMQPSSVIKLSSTRV